jgi:hypothetical protein
VLTANDHPPVSAHELAWRAHLKSRLNAIYYRLLIARLERTDKAVRLVSAFLASGGVTAALKWGSSQSLAIGVGVVAAFVTVWGMVSGYGEQIKLAAALLPQYVERGAKFRSLWLAQAQLSDIEKAMAALDRVEQLEAEKVRSVDRVLLERARQILMKEIGVDPQSPSGPAAAKTVEAA